MDLPWLAINNALAPFAALLLLGNLWFVSRLVGRIDKIDRTVTERLPVQQTELLTVGREMVDMKNMIHSLSNELKHVGTIRERIAVLEAGYHRPGRTYREDG